MWSIARRPKWIAALVLALAVAAAFAALGQWQIERSVVTGTILERDTETAVPLVDITEPQMPMTQKIEGQQVTVAGTFVDDDYTVVSGRHNAGQSGYWVVGHLVTAEGAGLAVALGWAEGEAEARAVADTLGSAEAELTGRYLASEGPQESDFQNREVTTVAPAALINVWQQVDPAGVYGGYLVAANPIGQLEAIDSPQPSTEIEVNWLNVFYAIEWVIFGGFAVFLWWRLVKDEWEKEQGQVVSAAEPAN